MSYTYQTWLAALATAIVTDPNDPDFLSIVPSAIDYAENRIYPELDLLNTVTRASGHLAANSRDFIIPVANGRIDITNGINLITPATVQAASAGKRNQLTPVSRDYLDAVGGDWSADGDHDNFFGATHVATGTIHHKIVNYYLLAFEFLIFSAGHRFFNIPSRCAIRLNRLAGRIEAH